MWFRFVKGVGYGSDRISGEQRGGLVLKAHRLLYHSTLGLTVINKKEKEDSQPRISGGNT